MRVMLENLAQFANDFVSALPPSVGARAHVVGLTGELGAGKTTFVQHVASDMGVAESVTSPTFVIMQKYPTKHSVFTTLVHIDAYRLKPEEAKTIGWEDTIKDPHALVLVEWPECLGPAFSDAHRMTFSVTSEFERDIVYAE